MVEHQNGRFVPRRPEAAAKDNDLQHAAGAPDVAGDGDHPVPWFFRWELVELVGMIRQQCSNTLQNIDQYWPVPVSLSPAVTTSVSRKDLPPHSGSS